MNLVDLSTLIFLVCSFLVLIPVSLVGWDMYLARRGDGHNPDVSLLAYMILLITVGVLIFHVAQFASVLLGRLGYSMQARVPVILMIDGSLVLLTAIYFYAYVKIRGIRNRLK